MFATTISTSNVATCVSNASILQIAQQMRRDHVGDVVVVEYRSGDPVPIGIVTDRDIVIEVMAKAVDPATITAGDLISRKLVSAYEGEQLDVVMERMRWSGIRRIPLIDSAGVLVGIVTLDDVIARLAATLNNISRVGQIQAIEEKVAKVE